MILSVSKAESRGVRRRRAKIRSSKGIPLSVEAVFDGAKSLRDLARRRLGSDAALSGVR
jgi:hypothetical protein